MRRALYALVLSTACAGSSTPSETGPSQHETGVRDTGSDTGGTAEPTYCEVLGLPARPFVETTVDSSLRALAADVTVETTRGPWSLASSWTGCDNYLFVPETPWLTESHNKNLWQSRRELFAMLEAMPPNTHLFFVPDTTSTDLDAVQRSIDEAAAALPGDLPAWWADHVHLVTTPIGQLPEPLKTPMANPRLGVAIDRLQRLTFLGSLSDYREGYSEAAGWYGPSIEMVVHEAVYRNFVADREERLQAESVTIVEGWTKEPIGNESDWGKAWDPEAWDAIDVTFPDAAAMAEFDTLELDFEQTCGDVGEVGYCPAWDRIARLLLCDDPDDRSTCSHELGRWITTYHREGRWVHDVSPLLPLLAEGGARRLLYESHDTWNVTLRFRLSNRGKELRADTVLPAFRGGGLGTSYNDREPITLAIPAEAKRTELVLVLSGHGMDTGNCAEFCNVTHSFTVGDTTLDVTTPNADVQDGCERKVGEGVVPNQPGTWWFGRAGWCPGQEVPVQRFDISDAVTPGETVELQYRARVPGGSGEPTSHGSIDLRSYLVTYQ